MKSRLASPLPWIVSGLLFAAALPLFLRLGFHSTADFSLHAEKIAQYLRDGVIPVHFVYHYGVAALAGFSPDVPRLVRATAWIVSLAFALKYLFSTAAAADWLDLDPRRAPARYRLLLASVVALQFVFCLPLPGQHWYLGQFPPNLWHNPTTLALLPIAVVLFHYSAAYLDRPDPRHLRWLVPLVLLANLTKPSLFFSYAPAFPLFVLLRWGPGRAFGLSLVPVVVGAVPVVLVAAQTFFDPTYGRIIDETHSGVALGWFFPWKEFSRNIPLSLINSFLLPLLFLSCYPRRFLADLRVRFAGLLALVGLPIFAFVHETGARAAHGNLGWQNFIANYLLHLSLLVAFLEMKGRDPAYSWRDRFLVGAFAVEALVGALYLGRFVATGDYF